MTGKELIIYILQNNLENEVVLKNGLFIDFMTEEEVALELGVGLATVRAWHQCGILEGSEIGRSIFFIRDKIKETKKRER